jgi:hypothetical protein
MVMPICYSKRLTNKLANSLTDATDSSQSAGTVGKSAENGTRRSGSANSRFVAGSRTGVEVGQWIIQNIRIQREGNSIGEIGERPEVVSWSESVVVEPGVDQVGTQITEDRTSFHLVISFINIIT